VKFFSLVKSTILPNRMTCSIFSVITTKSEKYCAKLLTSIQSMVSWKCCQINWSSFFQQRRINLYNCLTPPLGVFSYRLLVVLFRSLQAWTIVTHIHIELILPNEGINEVLLLFYLGIIQPHIPSKDNVTQAFLKEVNQQFLIIDHLNHFVVVCLKMSYMTWSSCIFDEFKHSKIFGNDHVGHQTRLNNLYMVM
jgi:hypothetical protein